MAAIRFGHLFTFTSAASIDDYLAEYVAQGFLAHEQTVRHPPGLRNGFVALGPDYLEFWWVEDEAQFALADTEQQALRAGQRPFGIGMVAQDVQALHDDWTARGYDVLPVLSRAPRDAPDGAPPAWSFQNIPRELLPSCLCLPSRTTVARLTTASMCVLDRTRSMRCLGSSSLPPRQRRERSVGAISWHRAEPVTPSGPGCAVQLGPHQATWMTPDTYEAAFGRPWTEAPHPCGDLALLHLLATDLTQMRRVLERAGRRLTPYTVNNQEALLIEPDIRDGIVLLVQ